MGRANDCVVVFDDRETLLEGAAERIACIAEEAITDRGRFTWALAGGKTPEGVYRLLAGSRFAGRIDWRRVQFFWGDERCVPPDHSESNYRMVREALLDAVAPPADHVHRMRGEDTPHEAAASYEAEVRRVLGAHDDGSPARLDLALLGMGADGHTASLFPGTSALAETTRWVAANWVEELAAWRLTLTPVVLKPAVHVVVLVVGAEKAARLAQALQGDDGDTPALPVQRIRPLRGDLVWLVDAAAASLLPG